MRRGLPVLVTLGLLAGGCATPSGVRVQGTVEDDLVVVTVPYLATPVVDLNAGFAASPGAGVSTGSASEETGVTAGVAAAAGLGSFVTVTEVAVAEGDTVTAGQPLVRLDDRLLQAQVKVAEAAAGATAAQVAVLDDRITDTREAEDEIVDQRAEVTDTIAELKRTRAKVKDAIAELTRKRAEVSDGIAQLTRSRAELLKQRQQLRTARAALVAQREQAQQALDQLPPGAPGQELQATIAALTAKIGELDQGLTTMDAGLKKLDAGLKQARAGLAKLDAGLKQAKTGLRNLETGLDKASDGLRKLDEAREEVLDARAELTRLRRLAAVAAEAAAVPVDLARADLAQATLSSPVAGTVVKAVAAGDLRAPGAGLVTIRRADEATLTAWLSPTQASDVCEGGVATITADWLADDRTVTATLTRIAPEAEFPPSSQATDEVHLTRAFRVELTAGEALPAGLPVTLSIQPCQPAAAGARR